MGKLTPKQKENLRTKVADSAAPLSVRRKAHRDLMDAFLNPKNAADFDPETFDPMEGVPDFEVKKRVRKDPPKRLPTLGLKPKELFEGQLIGMFESKQDLYLLIAWLSHRVSDLEDQVNMLRGGNRPV